jgi:hypothetical protein
MFQIAGEFGNVIFQPQGWSEKKVNRVRVMRRGWDALNMNFNSPVQYSEALAVYIGFQAKNGHLSFEG